MVTTTAQEKPCARVIVQQELRNLYTEMFPPGDGFGCVEISWRLQRVEFKMLDYRVSLALQMGGRLNGGPQLCMQVPGSRATDSDSVLLEQPPRT